MTARATVLNVDDYLPGRYARSRVLRDAGFTVLEAASGEEALRLVATRRPDVVLLDYNLPDMTGVEVCRQIKQAPETSWMPVLQISATSKSVEHKVEAMNEGADTYLTEPIAPAELVAHVNAALRYRWAEERLRESNQRIAALYEEAQRANRAKDDFLAVLSHELRTPLNAMLGWLQLLHGERLGEEQRRSALEIIERNAHAQARLIEDLLDVSRIVSGQLSIASKTVDLVSIVRNAAHTVAPAAAEKDVELALELDADRLWVNGDAPRLQQVVVNLLSNAVKFTDRGRVVVSLQRRDDGAVVEVRDSGIGIVPEFLPYVFDRFKQADSSKTRPHGGLGIGLAIARYLVEAHGGRITAHSDGYGKGAVFAFELPEALQETEIAVDSAVATTGQSAQALAGLQIVLVEDDADSREMMMLLLEQSGATVVPAANAKAAIDAIAARVPDVLVADVGLPHMDGYAMLRELRSRGLVMPAVALTGYTSEADRLQALNAGFTHHLGKPVIPEELIDALARASASRAAK
jgi:signal transduction histidine kinase